VLAADLLERLGRERDNVIVIDLSGIPDKSTYPNAGAIRTWERVILLFAGD
jgi:hypothetical protein